jgi:hypothetical protein
LKSCDLTCDVKIVKQVTTRSVIFFIAEYLAINRCRMNNWCVLQVDGFFSDAGICRKMNNKYNYYLKIRDRKFYLDT